MINSILTTITAVVMTIGGWFGIQHEQPNLGVFSDPFISVQLATSPVNGRCLTTDGTNNVWSSTCGSGAGGSSIGESWAFFNSKGWLAPTTTVGIIVNAASSTITNLVTIYSTSTDATSTNSLNTSGNLSFYGEIMPDGLACANGEILKKTGANNWDCAADDAGAAGTIDGVGAAGMMTSWVDANTVQATSTIIGEQFIATSSTATSTFAGDMTVGTGSTWFTINGNTQKVGIGTSTPYSRLSVVGTTTLSLFEATSTTATSSIAGGLKITGGGLRINTLVSCDTIDTDGSGNFQCGSDASGGSGASIGEAWSFFNSKAWLAPTTTVGIIVNAASSTITNLVVTNATTTSATTTNQNYTGIVNKLLSTDATGNVVGTTTISTNLLNLKSFTVTTAAPLGGAATVNLGDTLALTCTGCLTANQTVTLSGDISGSGATSIVTAINPATRDWKLFSPTILQPTTTPMGILINNSTSTITSLQVVNGTTTNATTTNLTISGLSDGCLSTATGKVTSTGVACSTGGSGTVNAGTTGQLPYYAADGTALTATSSLFLTPAGRLGVGKTNPVATIEVVPGDINLRSGVSDSASIIMQKSNGTVGTPSGLADQDPIAYFQMQGYDGANTSFATGVEIASLVDGDVSGSLPTSLLISTQTIGGLLTEKVRIKPDGRFGIATTSPWAKLSVTNISANPSFIVEDAASPDSTPFIVDTTGNVGIGTSSPSQKLSILGNIYATGGATTTGLASSNLVSCDTIDTDSQGNLKCGADASGGAGGASIGEAWAFFDTKAYLAPTTSTPIIVNNATSTITNLFMINSTSTNATSTSLYTTKLGTNSEYFTDLTGTGLSNSGGVLTNSGIITASCTGATCSGTNPLTINVDGSSTFRDWKLFSTTILQPSTTPMGIMVNNSTSTITNLWVTNGTTTNATSTNLFATTTVMKFATTTNIFSTTASSTNLFTSTLGVATSSPMSPLSVVGNEDHWGNYYHFGSAVPTYKCVSQSCIDLWGDDNTTNGVQIVVGNKNGGTSAYSGFSALNDRASSNVTDFVYFGVNSSTYTDTTFGTGVNGKSQALVQNSMAGLSLVASTSTSPTNAWINALVGGSNSGNEVWRTTPTGFGIGTTTPAWSLQIASITPYMTMTDTDAPVNKKHGLFSFMDGLFKWGTSSDALSGTTTAMQLDPTGVPMFGIGTTSPWGTISAISINPTVPMFTLASTTGNATTTVFQVDTAGHRTSSSTAPTVSSGVVDGTDQVGTVSSCSSACTITFARPFPRTPTCIVFEDNAGLVNAITITRSATTLVVTQTGLGTFNYSCGIGSF